MTDVRRRPIIVFASSYIQFQTYCQWKGLDYKDREEAVPIYNSSKQVADALVTAGIAPVHKDSIVVLPGARALKNVQEKVRDSASA